MVSTAAITLGFEMSILLDDEVSSCVVQVPSHISCGLKIAEAVVLSSVRASPAADVG